MPNPLRKSACATLVAMSLSAAPWMVSTASAAPAPPAETAKVVAEPAFQEVSLCGWESGNETVTRAFLLGAFVELGHWSNSDQSYMTGGCPYEYGGYGDDVWHASVDSFTVTFDWRAGKKHLATKTVHVHNYDATQSLPSGGEPSPGSSLHGKFVASNYGWVRVGKHGSRSKQIVLHVTLKKKGYQTLKLTTRTFRTVND